MMASAPLDFANTILRTPYPAATYTAHQLLTEHTGRVVIQGDQGLFNLKKFAKAGKCVLTVTDRMHQHSEFDWESEVESYSDTGCAAATSETTPNNKLEETTLNVWYDVEWEGHRLELVLLALPRVGDPACHYYFLITDDRAVGERLIAECSRFNLNVEDCIWVFSDGYWSSEEDASEMFKSCTFDNLILGGNLKKTIQNEIDMFFSSRELYAKYDAPWKRGFLFSGPPGNGKTHFLKAIMSHCLRKKPRVTVLLVKSFKGCGQLDEHRIGRIFKRARQRPSLLIFEDLDSLVTDENRSFFLNELDGLKANNGVMCVATTNHPERLDPAIRDRPSRFDRHFTFGLPTFENRLAFLKLWATGKGKEVAISDDVAKEVCEDAVTGGFSYAYMKELMLASIVRWLHGENRDDHRVPFADILREQAEVLRSHVKRDEEAEAKSADAQK
ncbi:hypothetical protein HDU87_006420 [Geranomyces variabilis]|uniref:AAA+ ATPase domain-containing protein n=1 Tax=Geranomyces variabilis TaxID=109894 RepID=A0AAD5TH20_9FUNG|nr:hypothetical protein HDU87_006420 [Geranomyces variabilis]